MSLGVLFTALLSLSVVEGVVLFILAFYLIPTAGSVSTGKTGEAMGRAMDQLGITSGALVVPAVFLMLAGMLLLVRSVLLLLALTIKRPYALTLETVETLLKQYAETPDLEPGGPKKKDVPAGVDAQAYFDEQGRYRAPEEEETPEEEEGEEGAGGEGQDKIEMEGSEEEESGSAKEASQGGQPQVQAVVDVPQVPSQEPESADELSGQAESRLSIHSGGAQPLLTFAAPFERSTSAATRSSSWMSATASPYNKKQEPGLAQSVSKQDQIESVEEATLPESEEQGLEAPQTSDSGLGQRGIPKSSGLFEEEAGAPRGEEEEEQVESDETVSISLKMTARGPGGQARSIADSSPAPSHFDVEGGEQVGEGGMGGVRKNEKATVMVSETIVNLFPKGY